ncbi:sensor histidine kinase [Pseudoroseicyclus aestuarii]|uniref:histidine kinase n=1 Tax=Pseudoroseicyclus aestuarii TaxID=1795041 RepID=A0A318SW13_9RHOB|nr:ATP-binding protein [Pseudoroseicyclus aestuarii]PYE86111.1 two-component system phosphate regulon sensor histidine kinase PhoR [Pseudoroseicyclus aestuarii]
MPPHLIDSLITALPYPILVIGPTERIEAANPAAVRLFGEGGIGRHYITALRQPAVLDVVEQTLRDGEARTGRYLGTEGRRETTWAMTAGAVQLPLGRGACLSFQDVTEVEEAGQIRRDFVANVSHELRTPLTALLGFVETLRGPARDDAVARDRFLGIMERETGRMAQLVSDLLSLSRVEQDERLRPMAPVDLRGLIEGVVAVVGPTAQGQGITLAVEAPEQQIVVPGDEYQLRQVLTNLIENAMKYGGPGKPVEIVLGEPKPEPSLRGEGVRLTVIDHGEGIAAHHIPRLTERFYRVDKHRSREVGGTGLGLAIVKHIVNRHRGRLRVDSALGQGSRFSVILPLS